MEWEYRVFTKFSEEELPTILQKIQAKAQKDNLSIPDQLDIYETEHIRGGLLRDAIGFKFVKTTGFNDVENAKVQNLIKILAQEYQNAFCYYNNKNVSHERH